MRGLVGQAVAAATWALATPVLADAPAYELLEHLDHAAAFFKVPLTKDAPELIRLDVTNTDAICDTTTLSINDQALPLGAHHLGQGTFTLPSGSTIEAIWTVTCVSYDQDGQLQFEPGNVSPVRDSQFVNMKPGMWIVVDIVRADGEEVHAGFEANFKQGGDYVRWSFADVYGADGVDGDKVEMVTHVGGEVDRTIPWERKAIQEVEQELERPTMTQGADAVVVVDEDWQGYDEHGLAGLLESEPTLEELGSLEHSAAYFNIDLGLYDEEDRHIIRLDIHDSDQKCDPEAKIYLAGEPLRRANPIPFSETHPDNLVETGFFTLPSGPRIQASWTVSCLSPDRYGPKSPLDHDDILAAEKKQSSVGVYVRVDIRAVDEVDVSHRNLGFDIEFEQDVRGIQWSTVNDHFPATRALLWGKVPDNHSWNSVIHSTPDGEAAQWEPLAVENQPPDNIPIPADDQEAAESPESVKTKCTDLKCLLNHMEEGMTIQGFQKLDAQAEELVNEILAKHNKKQKPLTSTQTSEEDLTLLIAHDPQHMKPITAMDSPSVSSDTSTATPTGLFLTSLPPQDQDLLLTLFLAGTAFLLFTLISLFIFKSRSEPTVQRLPVHRETPEERLARVANRRHAFASFFCGLFTFSEKPSEVAPQGRDLRTEEPSSTMEQEISQFREAANMVKSMIAAEEGRHHGRQSETGNVEASPPSYENDSADSGVVADGFRYTRVADGAWGEGDNEGDDRLGYGNK